MKNVKDLSGTKFRRWNIIERASDGKQGHVRWKCRCDCGTESIVYGFSLREDAPSVSSSCGCLRREKTKERFTKHGYELDKKALPEYSTWHSMIQRCGNKNANQYEDYGGRGITVCERWKDFRNFIADMGNKPSKDYSIDRIDNNGNYEPNNCRWSSPHEQSINKRIRSDNTTGTKGVSWYKAYNKYQVRVWINGKKIHIGYFERLQDAIEARKKAELKYY